MALESSVYATIEVDRPDKGGALYLLNAAIHEMKRVDALDPNDMGTRARTRIEIVVTDLPQEAS